MRHALFNTKAEARKRTTASATQVNQCTKNGPQVQAKGLAQVRHPPFNKFTRLTDRVIPF